MFNIGHFILYNLSAYIPPNAYIQQNAVGSVRLVHNNAYSFVLCAHIAMQYGSVTYEVIHESDYPSTSIKLRGAATFLLTAL